MRRICEKTEGIRRWWRNRADIGRVPREKCIQRESSYEVKGERVSWEESWQVGVSGGGRDVRGCGGKVCAERQHGNVDLRLGGRKRLRDGGRLSGGGGRLMRLEVKWPRLRHPDAACGIRTHWGRPFHFMTE